MHKDLRDLPKVRDSLSFIYVEHATIEQDNFSIMLIQKDGRIPIPIASLNIIFIGPGTKITHAAIRAICDNGCSIVWCGEHAERFYACGFGETRNSTNILKQAKCCMDKNLHMDVVKRMYERRFPKLPERDYTVEQLRGMEGVRVKEAYKFASKNTGVSWHGRSYKDSDWDDSDDVNRALSSASACLYGLCAAVVTALGYSTALGFVHTGKMLSFVYDIADLYKAETTIPAAFEAVKEGGPNIEQRVRKICRQYFKRANVLKRIPEDIAWILSCDLEEAENINHEQASDLWGKDGNVCGGLNRANTLEAKW